MSTAKKGSFAAAVISAAVVFTPVWEGEDHVAKRDMIGTGNPITYCNGLTSHDGKVSIDQKFTHEQCQALLRPALAKYWKNIEPCIKVVLPVKTAASLLDAGFNAGETAVCRSPMLAKMNAGDLKGGCEAFSNWYITTKNQGVRKVIPGLVNRRGGNKSDPRKDERELCLEGVRDGVPKPPSVSLWAKVQPYLSAAWDHPKLALNYIMKG